tara:strand:+ start:7111 stop:7425 length:315 start_codon:yes stop_codon:yes gene_type:complete
MIQVKVLRPYRVKGDISCKECGLSYSKKHYDVLFKAKKLVYFEVKDEEGNEEVICHDCFFKYLVKKANVKDGDPYEINFSDGRKKMAMEFTADFSVFMDDFDDF